jgi:hypothetical protein
MRFDASLCLQREGHGNPYSKHQPMGGGDRGERKSAAKRRRNSVNEQKSIAIVGDDPDKQFEKLFLPGHRTPKETRFWFVKTNPQ